MIAAVIILLLALQVFFSMIKSKIEDAFSDPTWLELEEYKTLFDHETMKRYRDELLKYKVELDVENSEYNYGHEVSKYHDDD